LIDSARAHSQWMVEHGIVDHFEGPGNDVEARAKAAGHMNGTGYAENLAQTFVTTPPAAAVEQLYHDLFVDSGQFEAAHRKILFRQAHEIGIGLAFGDFTGSAAALVTENFSTEISPDSAKYLVGVVYSYFDDEEQFYRPGRGFDGIEVRLSQGDTYAITSSSGGYAIPIDTLSGELTVSFKNGPVTWSKQTVMLQSKRSVKVDCPIHSWWWFLLWLLPFLLKLLGLR